MDDYKKKYKYLTINTLTDNVAHFNNYRDICGFINNNDITNKLTLALISRRFKSKNHFTFDTFIIMKIIW
jgi:hypothetical protein